MEIWNDKKYQKLTKNWQVPLVQKGKKCKYTKKVQKGKNVSALSLNWANMIFFYLYI